MKNIKQILVASELDTEAVEVMEYAVTLGMQLDARIHCIHVSNFSLAPLLDPDSTTDIELAAGESEVQRIIKNQLVESKEALKNIVKIVAIKMKLEQLDVDLSAVTGPVVPSILQCADEIEADLIVAGAHIDIESEGIIDNLAYDIIDKGEKSVLVVPSTYINRNLDEVALFINFEVEEISLLMDLIENIEKLDIRIKCIHVVEEMKDLENAAKRLVTYKRLFFDEISKGGLSFQIEEGTVPEVIDDLQQNEGVDLMILRIHKRHWNLFTKSSSFATKVFKNIRIPILAWSESIRK